MRTRNALLNLLVANAGKFLSLATYFYVTPRLLNLMGQSDYGAYQLVLQIVSYLNLIEFGIGVSLSLATYDALAKNDFSRVSSYASGAQKFYSLLGLFLIVCGGFCSLFFKDAFHLHQVENVNLALLLFTINVSLSYFFNVPVIVLQATQKAYYIGWFSVFLQPCIAISSLCSVYFGYSLLGIAVVTLLANFIYYQIVNVVIFRRLPWLSVFAKIKDYSFLRGTAQYVFVDKIMVLMVFQTDYLVISYFLDVSFVSTYSVYMSLFMQVTAVISLLVSSAQAGVGELMASGDKTRVLSVWKELVSISFGVVILVVPLVIVFFDRFYKVWINTEPLGRGVLYAMLANFVYLNTIFPTTLMVNTKNLFRERVVGSVAELVINLGVSLFLVGKMGVMGVVIGTSIGHYLTNFWYLPYLFASSNQIPISFYLKHYGQNLCVLFGVIIASTLLHRSTFSTTTTIFLLAVIYFLANALFLFGNRQIIDRLLGLRTLFFSTQTISK